MRGGVKVGRIAGKLMPVCGKASEMVGNRGSACGVDRAICSRGGGVIVIIDRV